MGSFLIFNYGGCHTALRHSLLASQFTYQVPNGEIVMPIKRKFE